MRVKIISVLLALISRVPLSAAQKFGEVVGWVMYKIPNKQRHIAQTNIAHCLPKLAHKEQQTLLRATLAENSKILIELPGILSGNYQRWVDRVIPGVGAHLYDEAIAKGKGVIAIGPHQGCWEVGLQHLSSIAEVTSPYRAPKLEYLDDWVKQGRGQGGATLVEATPSGVKALLSALRKGNMVAMLADQQPKAAGKHGSVYAPFFGLPALTMVLASRLACKTEAPVLFWFMERLPKGQGYRMNWFSTPAEIYSPDQIESATALNLGLEQCILQCPEQYLWTYKRFDRQPNGRRSPYKRS